MSFVPGTWTDIFTPKGGVWAADVQRYFSDDEWSSGMNLLELYYWMPFDFWRIVNEDRADPQVRAAFRVSNVATLLAAQRKLPPSERMRVRVKAGSRRIGRG